MRKTLPSFLVFVLLAGALPGAARAADPSLPEKLAQLDLRLPRLRSGAHRRRYWGGGILLASAVGFGVGAVVEGNKTSGNHTSESTALGISAGVLGVLGGLELALPTAYETLPAEYNALPAASDAERERKVMIGEDTLNRLAEKAYKQRIWTSGIVTGVGVAETIGGAVSNSSGKSGEITAGVIVTALGAVGFFLKHPAENERDDYYAWRDGHHMQAIDWDLAPVKKGGQLLAGIRF